MRFLTGLEGLESHSLGQRHVLPVHVRCPPDSDLPGSDSGALGHEAGGTFQPTAGGMFDPSALVSSMRSAALAPALASASRLRVSRARTRKMPVVAS